MKLLTAIFATGAVLLLLATQLTPSAHGRAADDPPAAGDECMGPECVPQYTVIPYIFDNDLITDDVVEINGQLHEDCKLCKNCFLLFGAQDDSSSRDYSFTKLYPPGAGGDVPTNGTVIRIDLTTPCKVGPLGNTNELTFTNDSGQIVRKFVMWCPDPCD